MPFIPAFILETRRLELCRVTLSACRPADLPGSLDLEHAPRPVEEEDDRRRVGRSSSVRGRGVASNGSGRRLIPPGPLLDAGGLGLLRLLDLGSRPGLWAVELGVLLGDPLTELLLGAGVVGDCPVHRGGLP
ncbi:hypothetical protein ACFW6X_33735 [Streptomyces bacillaris]|uniref:hypothetical protein n=1 Tax=Streptomyces bacillaris TaxID=68179 RepID=UPI00367C4060